MKFLRDRWRWLLNGAVLVGLLIAGAKYLSGGQFWKALAHFHWVYAPLILGLTLLYLAIRGLRLGVALHFLSRLDRLTAGAASVSGEGAALMPGGVMTYLAMLGEVGVKVADSGASVAWISVLDQGLFVSLSLLAALWIQPARAGAIAVLAVLVSVGVLWAMPLTRLWIAVAWQTVLLHLRLLTKWQDGIASIRKLMTARIVGEGVLLTLAAALAMAGALDVTVSGLGANISFASALLAYTLSSMLGRLTPLPGGIGVTEAALVGVFASCRGLGFGEVGGGNSDFSRRHHALWRGRGQRGLRGGVARQNRRHRGQNGRLSQRLSRWRGAGIGVTFAVSRRLLFRVTVGIINFRGLASVGAEAMTKSPQRVGHLERLRRLAGTFGPTLALADAVAVGAFGLVVQQKLLRGKWQIDPGG